MYSGWVWACAGLAALAAAAEITTPRQFEVDIVFPHNETYMPADTMPIVLAIQNVDVALSLGGFVLYWAIRQVHNNTPSRTQFDSGKFRVTGDEPLADTTMFLVDFTNATDWSTRGDPVPPATTYTPALHDRFLLQWSIFWTSVLPTCTEAHSFIAQLPSQGALTFNIRRVQGEGDWQGEIHDVQEALPECPEFSGQLQIGPAPNGTIPGQACPTLGRLENREGNPCAVTVDQRAASSISSRVLSSVSSSIAATATVASTTSSAGVGPLRPVQTALAAACVLCGLAL